MSRHYQPNTIDITVTGAVNSGKTAVTAIIAKALAEAGFTCQNVNLVNTDCDISHKIPVIEQCVESMLEKKVCINLIDNNGNSL